MFCIEDKNFLTEKQKDFIDNIVLGSNFPFFVNNYTVNKDDGQTFLNHTVLHRPEERNKTTMFNPYLKSFEEIFDTFCTNNNINYEEILRCSVNLTYFIGNHIANIHHDHYYDYKQLLIYLNQPEGGDTVILDEDKETEIKRIKPEKYKGVTFDRQWHYQTYPRYGRRVLAVYTYR
tara:strand:+ start:396 stop:923 length:528 start_codon:yes stop_codon:yes gene_type:complete